MAAMCGWLSEASSRFALEARHALGVVGYGLGQHLDGDVAAEGHVGRAPDHAHPTLADLLDEAIVREIAAGGE